VEKALKLLEVDGAVQRRKTVFQRTANPWTPDLLNAEQVTQQRRAELEQMRRYVEHSGCLMEFLARALDDPAPKPCGRCMNCTGQTARRAPPAALVRQAVEFLRGDIIVIEPRSRWPKAALGDVRRWMAEAVELFEDGQPKVTIPPALRSEQGRALCIYGDAGWGREVADGKYGTGRFSDALVAGAARVIREKWSPQPPPAWVTAVPSQRHPQLVSDFAERLAAALAVPFVPVLRQARATTAQKEMQNSVLQIRNLLGAFEVAAPPPSGPAVLVDDMVDSGWTLTLLAVLLRRHESGPIYPFALAKSSPRGG
jgi:ATP-dependent DNA helicase RecQ